MRAILEARQLRPAWLPPAIAAHAPALDFELQPGQLCCLIGPQDTGKTGWLRTLAAVDPPLAGTLRIAGLEAPPRDAAAWRQLRAKAGYISDGTPLLSVQNALSNVMLAAQYHGLGDGDELRRRALQWLERLGWNGPGRVASDPGALDRLPAHLTRHQRCLLMLARCLMLDPAVLFVNEPFHLTDVYGWRHLAQAFMFLAREFSLAIVMLTHDLPFVRRHADRILFTSGDGIREYRGWSDFAAAGDAAGRYRETAELAFAGA